MNKQEIDEMMRHLPSQRMYYEETVSEKILAGLSFLGFLLIIAFM